MQKNRLTAVVGILILLMSSWAFSSPITKLTPRPPIYGIPAKTLPQGKWVFRGYWILPQFDKMYNSAKNEMVDIPSSLNFTSNSAILKIRYGLSNRLTAIVNLPYVSKQLEKPGLKKSGSGLGDVIGALLWKAHHNRQTRFLYSFLLFTKYPTGVADNLSAAELPLGTGSFDIGAAFLPEKEFGKWDLRWSAFYIARGNNKKDVNLGDALSFSSSAAYNFSKKFIAEGTLLYKRTGDNSKDGSPIAGSNAWLVQFIPGIQYRIAQTFLTQLAMPITLQSKRPFSDTYEPWIGLYYLF